MKEHAALNQRVWDWITRRGWSRRRVAREAGIKEATFGRMLDDATYQTDPENWRRLARYLGHSSISTTLNVYAHALDRGEQALIDRLGRLMQPLDDPDTAASTSPNSDRPEWNESSSDSHRIP
jgi:integrase